MKTATIHFTNEHKRRYICPHCKKTYIGLVPRGGDGTVRQFPYHTMIVTTKHETVELKCMGSFKVCK